MRELVAGIECAVVKEGVGKATKNIPIEDARKLIRKMTFQSLKARSKVKVHRMKPPYTVELTLHYPEDAYHVSQLPGARRTSERAVAYTHEDLLEALKFLTNSMFMIAGALE
jgi:D-aminopeptidase